MPVHLQAKWYRAADGSQPVDDFIEYRLEHDLTQKELAHKIGTSHSAVSRLESGQATVSLKTMKRVAEALGGRLLVGFEIESGNHEVVRDLVAV
jgi:transcriptional regulator with XRE-family HTH domain